jgi:hypothetical protein
VIVAVAWSMLGDGAGRRRIALGALFSGWGLGWIVVLGLAATRSCGQTETTGCSGPDLLPFATAAAGAFVVGVALIFLGSRAAGEPAG